MADTTSSLFVQRLIDWGVDTVFGLPGDGINGVFEALRVNQEKIRFIQVRHEEAAAFAACAYAKFTGRLGVCIATSGPGAIHLLNGLYDAKMDGQPVLAITGQTYHDLLGQHYQQEVDLISLFKDVTVYNEMVLGAQHVEPLTDSACRAALAEHGVAHLTFPVDVQEEKTSQDHPSRMNVPGHTSLAWHPPVVVPLGDEVLRAAEILNAGTRTVILAGQGALGARRELEEAAERLAAPIIKALLGKACVPDESPYTTGGIGLLGTRPSEKAMEECDTLLIVGSSFPYLQFYPQPGAARAVQIDRDATRIGLRYPVELGLVGDAQPTLDLLLPHLRRREDRSFLEHAQHGMAEWWKLMDSRADRDGRPMKPQTLAAAVDRMLADDAIVTTDSGTITTWAARHIRIRGRQHFSCSGNLATMAPGLPYAVAAQVAYPGRQVVAFVGDGGFTMLMGEFATAVKYKLPIRVVIVKNNTLGQIKWEQMVFLGNPEFAVDLHPIDFVKYAEACGGVGVRCETREEIGPALERAFAADGPALVEATVDPYEPPMPAQVTPEQAVHLAEALARGEPHRGRIALTIFRDKIKDLTA